MSHVDFGDASLRRHPAASRSVGMKLNSGLLLLFITYMDRVFSCRDSSTWLDMQKSRKINSRIARRGRLLVTLSRRG